MIGGRLAGMAEYTDAERDTIRNAAFGAIAFTVGKYGLASLLSLGQLMACMYLTCVAFVFVVLNAIARISGFSLWKFLRYIKDEIFTVLGTSSSESVVPQLMHKLEHLGVSKPVVGLVVPAGVTLKPTGVIAVPSGRGPAWVANRAAAAAPPVTTRARVATAAAARERGRSTRESSCV